MRSPKMAGGRLSMLEARLRPLMDRFGQIVTQNSALTQTFSVV